MWGLVTYTYHATQPAMTMETQDPNNKTRYISLRVMFIQSNLTHQCVMVYQSLTQRTVKGPHFLGVSEGSIMVLLEMCN